jgi:hypothetical protein
MFPFCYFSVTSILATRLVDIGLWGLEGNTTVLEREILQAPLFCPYVGLISLSLYNILNDTEIEIALFNTKFMVSVLSKIYGAKRHKVKQ